MKTRGLHIGTVCLVTGMIHPLISNAIPLPSRVNLPAEVSAPTDDDPVLLLGSGATLCVAGFAGAFPCSNVDLMAHVPLASIGGGSGNDIWGWTGCGGREFALMGRSSGTAFVEITDPENPIYLGNLPTQTSNSTWRDIKTYANHAFIVSEASGHGMQVFDLSQLCSVASPPVTFSNTAHYNGFSSAHNIVVNEDSGFAYAVGTDTCSGGLHMINISNPIAPANAGCFSSDGYTHDAQCVVYNGADVAYLGNEICFNANEDTLTVVDVTNKAAPLQISRTGYPGSAYTHQGWVTEDHLYYLMDDELDESNSGHNTRTRIWDLTDLDNPVLIGFHDGSTAAIDHNLYVHDGFVFEANYSAGLQILDLADIANANLSEVAYFDTYPSSNSTGFNGAWSVYPYFASGIVVVSDISSGLFVLRPTALNADFAIGVVQSAISVCDPGSETADVELQSLSGYTGAVSLSAAGLPALAGYSFTPPVVDLPGTTSSLLQINTFGAPPGSYPLTITGDDGLTAHDDVMTVDIFSGVPPAPAGVSPPDGQSLSTLFPELTWTPLTDTENAVLEIDDDPSFASVDYSATVAGTSHTVATPLAASTLYSWRITASNACGAVMSSALTFVTPNIVCDTFTSTDVPLPIPEGGGTSGTTTSTLAVATEGPVVSLAVGLAGTHTFMGDLDFALQSPQATSVTIMDTSGCGSVDDFNLTLDDAAAAPFPCPPTGGGAYLPSNPLAAFNGEALSGSWILTVTDSAGGDVGTLDAWDLQVCYGVSTPLPPEIFSDGFEGGDTTAWSEAAP